MTAADLELAYAQMSQSDTELRTILKHVSPRQWTWKPDAETWSLSEITEHLAIVEQGILFRLCTAPADGFDKTVGKDRLPAMLANRQVKFPAPARTQPRGKFATPADCLAQLSLARAATLSWAQDQDTKLMQHVMPHPAFGELHGGQWLQMLAGHTFRHLEQMRELIAKGGYPGPVPS